MEHIGEILSGNNLRTNSSRECAFCGAQLEPMALILGRPFGAKRCTCEGARAYWQERDEIAAQERRAEEEAQRKERLETLFRNSMLPSRWKNRTFENFVLTENNQTAFERARQYAERFDANSGDGLLFTGDVGLGKTHLAAAIAMHLLEREHTVVFGTVTSLLSQLRNTYDDHRETEKDVMRRLTRCQLLVIDDLGKEKVSPWVEQTVFEIINARYDDNKSVIITTNMDLPEIEKKYKDNGKALLDRIFEMCKGIKLSGKSWRKQGM